MMRRWGEDYIATGYDEFYLFNDEKFIVEEKNILI